MSVVIALAPILVVLILLALRVTFLWGATVAGTALAFLLLGIVMVATGMAEHLAITAARMGLSFTAVVPAIGARAGISGGSGGAMNGWTEMVEPAIPRA